MYYSLNPIEKPLSDPYHLTPNREMIYFRCVLELGSQFCYARLASYTLKESARFMAVCMGEYYIHGVMDGQLLQKCG